MEPRAEQERPTSEVVDARRLKRDGHLHKFYKSQGSHTPPPASAEAEGVLDMKYQDEVRRLRRSALS